MRPIPQVDKKNREQWREAAGQEQEMAADGRWTMGDGRWGTHAGNRRWKRENRNPVILDFRDSVD